jgi:hypothetical protein
MNLDTVSPNDEPQDIGQEENFNHQTIGLSMRQIFADPAHREALAKQPSRRQSKSVHTTNYSEKAAQAMVGMLGSAAKNMDQIDSVVETMSQAEKEKFARLRNEADPHLKNESKQSYTKFSHKIDEALEKQGFHLVVNGGTVTVNIHSQETLNPSKPYQDSRNRWGNNAWNNNQNQQNRKNYDHYNWQGSRTTRFLRGLENFINGR